MTDSQQSLSREDILLLLAQGAADGSYEFDAIRAMKGCFVVSERGVSDWKTRFNFRPYDYGPFDSGVYRSRDQLLSEGLLAEIPAQYPAYVLTEAGRARCAEIASREGAERVEWLHRIGRWTTSRSFAELLREVYAEFPGFATRSVARVG